MQIYNVELISINAWWFDMQIWWWYGERGMGNGGERVFGGGCGGGGGCCDVVDVVVNADVVGIGESGSWICCNRHNKTTKN